MRKYGRSGKGKASCSYIWIEKRIPPTATFVKFDGGRPNFEKQENARMRYRKSPERSAAGLAAPGSRKRRRNPGRRFRGRRKNPQESRYASEYTSRYPSSCASSVCGFGRRRAGCGLRRNGRNIPPRRDRLKTRGAARRDCLPPRSRIGAAVRTFGRSDQPGCVQSGRHGAKQDIHIFLVRFTRPLLQAWPEPRARGIPYHPRRRPARGSPAVPADPATPAGTPSRRRAARPRAGSPAS